MRENEKKDNGPADKDRIVLIGLDSCDVDLVERWSKEGRLPFLSSLMSSNVFSRLISTKGLFSDSPWPSFNAGVSPAKHGFYNHLQMKRGATEIERIDARHCRYLPFWSLLQDSGKKTAIFDVPKTFPIQGMDGILVSAWGEHYPLLKQPTSQAPDFLREMIARFGKYSHPREIIEPWSDRQERRIFKTISSNLERKLQATEYLMNLEDWDLFISVFSEVHYAGHQFYHHLNNDHWAHDSKASTDLHDAMPNLYAQLDKAISDLFRHIFDQTTFFIVSVHGFAVNYSANHLMPEVLEKLGYQVASTNSVQSDGLGNLLQLNSFVRNLVPQSVRDFINTHIVPESMHDRAYSNAFRTSVDWKKN